MDGIIRLEGATLRVLDRLTWAEAEEFQAACDDLVASGAVAPAIDFSLAGRVTTPYVGILTATAERCRFYGRPLSLVISPNQAHLLMSVGFEKLGRLRVLDGEEELGAGLGG